MHLNCSLKFCIKCQKKDRPCPGQRSQWSYCRYPPCAATPVAQNSGGQSVGPFVTSQGSLHATSVWRLLQCSSPFPGASHAACRYISGTSLDDQYFDRSSKQQTKQLSNAESSVGEKKEIIELAYQKANNTAHALVSIFMTMVHISIIKEPLQELCHTCNILKAWF